MPDHKADIDVIPERRDVPALQKGLRVLELLADEGPLSLAEVQRGSGLNKTMAFRVLRALTDLGYVEHDNARHRYQLGLRLLALGSAVSRRLDIVEIARPHLVRLRDEFGETVNLGVLSDGAVVYLGMQEGQLGLRMSARLGSRDPIHSTSLGKAMLAYLPRARQRELIAAARLDAHTQTTIVEPELLEQELERTRARGYALDDEENEVGARCVGVPILDSNSRPIAGLSVSGPAARVSKEDAGEIAIRLWAASAQISRAMGYEPGGAGERPLRREEVLRDVRLAG